MIKSPVVSGPVEGLETDVVTIGETMVMLTPPAKSALDQANSLAVEIGGAESNVAMYLAGLGHEVQWAGGVGADPFGRIILRKLNDIGVRTDAASVETNARTGVYFKDPGGTKTNVHYYRDASAASRLTSAMLNKAALFNARVVHLSGITAALSSSALELMRSAIIHRALGSPLISFDVNFRPALWSPEDAAPLLEELVNSSDLVFVGLDEAQTLWGCKTAAEVRAKFPDPLTLVVKNDGHGAESFGPRGRIFVPAPLVEIIEVVGAGDAFAAGYLSGLLEELPDAKRLRKGHLVAAQALSVVSDYTETPSEEWFDEHLKLSDNNWNQLELPSPGGGVK